jgi:amidohydrolase
MNSTSLTICLAFGLTLGLIRSQALANDSNVLETEIRTRSAAVEKKLIAWREDIHQHPELGEQEFRTSRLVVDHLRSLGLEVRTNIAHTGVVGLLRGAKPGRTVALRADMDALPVKEPDGLPFASKARQPYVGKEVDVMHACGHDAHTAMLMATAEVLDFSEFAKAVPGLYVYLGITPSGQDPVLSENSRLPWILENPSVSSTDLAPSRGRNPGQIAPKIRS